MDDIIPSNELGRLFQTPENHRRFVDKIQKWQDVVPVYSPDWKNAYLNVHDPVSNKLWIVLHLQSALDEGDVNAIQTYCQYIPRNEDYILLMLKSWTKLLPTNADDDMCRILYSWATYSRRSGGFYPMDYNRYDRPKAIWDMVTKQPIFDTRLKMLVQRVGRELNEMWEKTEENK